MLGQDVHGVLRAIVQEEIHTHTHTVKSYNRLLGRVFMAGIDQCGLDRAGRCNVGRSHSHHLCAHHYRHHRLRFWHANHTLVSAKCRDGSWGEDAG